MRRNAKIIQLVSDPTNGALYALTEEGRIFEKILPNDGEDIEWLEVPTDNFVHRTGNLI